MCVCVCVCVLISIIPFAIFMNKDCSISLKKHIYLNKDMVI